MDATVASVLQYSADLGKSFAWYAGAVFVIHLAERRWPAGPQTTIREQGFNFLLSFLVAISMAAINTIGPLAPTVVAKLGVTEPLLAGWIPYNWVGWIAGALLYAFVWDFFQYWFHVLQHRVGALWLVHALHHDSRAFNSSDALRSTLWSGFLQGAFIGIPVLILGVDRGLHPYAAILLFSIWGFYNHANIRIGHGPLTAVLSGPHFHRIHHDVDPRRHKNFAAFFPVIDIVFGTYQAPARGQAPLTGLSDRVQSRGGPLSAMVAMLGIRPRYPAAGGDLETTAAASARS